MATVVPEVVIAKAGAVVCGDNYELATLGASSVPPVSLVASYLPGTNNKFLVSFMITDGQGNIHPFAWMGSSLSAIKELGQPTNPILATLEAYVLRGSYEECEVRSVLLSEESDPDPFEEPAPPFDAISSLCATIDIGEVVDSHVSKEKCMAIMACEAGTAFVQAMNSPGFPMAYSNQIHRYMAVKPELASATHPYHTALKGCQVKVQRVSSIDFFKFDNNLKHAFQQSAGIDS